LKLWTIDQLLDEQLPVEPTIVDPFFPTHGIGVLHGRQTAGKTQTAMTLALSIAQGSYFLDQFKCEQGPVLYIQVDMPDTLIQARARMAEDLLRGNNIHLLTENNRINVLTFKSRYGNLLQPIRDTAPLLTVVDSLRKVHRLDENESGSASEVYGSWKDLLPDSTFLFLHHESQEDTSANAKAKSPDEKARGNTAWIDDSDLAIQVKRVGRFEGGDHTATLLWTKHRLCAEADLPPIDILMKEDTLLVEPINLTARHYGLIFLRESDFKASKNDFKNYLSEILNSKTGKPICNRQRAYKLYGEIMEAHVNGQRKRGVDTVPGVDSVKSLQDKGLGVSTPPVSTPIVS
jgi:hypothetical protein